MSFDMIVNGILVAHVIDHFLLVQGFQLGFSLVVCLAETNEVKKDMIMLFFNPLGCGQQLIDAFVFHHTADKEEADGVILLWVRLIAMGVQVDAGAGHQLLSLNLDIMLIKKIFVFSILKENTSNFFKSHFI